MSLIRDGEGSDLDELRRSMPSIERNRLTGLQRLLERWRATGPWSPLCVAIECGSPRDAGTHLTRALCVAGGAISPGRARILAANVVLPFALAQARLRDEWPRENRALDVYGALAALPSNTITRLLARQLGMSRLPSGAASPRAPPPWACSSYGPPPAAKNSAPPAPAHIAKARQARPATHHGRRSSTARWSLTSCGDAHGPPSSHGSQAGPYADLRSGTRRGSIGEPTLSVGIQVRLPRNAKRTSNRAARAPALLRRDPRSVGRSALVKVYRGMRSPQRGRACAGGLRRRGRPGADSAAS